MKDIVVITCDARLLNAFLNYPVSVGKEKWNGCRIWAVTDNRVRHITEWNERQSKHFWQREHTGFDSIQKVISSAVGNGFPIYPSLISGYSIVQHYLDKWGDELSKDCYGFLKTNVFSVKVLAACAMRDFFDLETVVTMDDDMAIFHPISELLDFDFAFSSTRNTSLKPFPHSDKNKEDFAILSEITTQGSVTFENYVEAAPNAGAMLTSDIKGYEDMWRRIFTNKQIASFRSHIASMIDQVAVPQWLIMNGAHIYSNESYGGDFFFSSPGPKFQKRRYMNPKVWHYASCRMEYKPFVAEWLSDALFVNKDNGRHYWERTQ